MVIGKLTPARPKMPGIKVGVIGNTNWQHGIHGVFGVLFAVPTNKLNGLGIIRKSTWWPVTPPPLLPTFNNNKVNVQNWLLAGCSGRTVMVGCLAWYTGTGTERLGTPACSSPRNHHA